MDFRILGPIEGSSEGAPLTLGGPRQRALLAYLLLHANETVSADRLLDELWWEPPRGGVAALQTQVSRLRKVLGDRLVSTSGGYSLRVEPEELDLERLRGLLAEAGTLRDPGERSRVLRDADALWRGEPLAELELPFVAAERAALEELRISAIEDRLAADADGGAGAALVPELSALVARYPLHERLRALLMLALYRSGRQAESLEVARETRRVLDEELGLEPSPSLRDLERAILRQDPSLDAPTTPPAASAPRRRRRTLLVASLAAVGAAVGATAAWQELHAAPVARPSAPHVYPVRTAPKSDLVTLSDDFSSPTTNYAMWGVANDGTGARAVQRNGRLDLSLPRTALPGGRYDQVGVDYFTQCRFDGNFDARVRFSLLDWPTGSGARLQLAAWIFPDTNSDAARVSSSSGERYDGNVAASWADLPTSDRQGSLRVARRGRILTSYARSNGAWVVLKRGVARGRVMLGLQLFAVDGDWSRQKVAAAFDDFRVTGRRPTCQ
jgi:DNA-binding SARP family transcriptional activator